MEDLDGKEFGPYRINESLGEGGMGTVYKAYQPNMDRYVAVKVLPKHLAGDPKFIGRFKQEALVLARLQHPHILPVFDYGECAGYTYLAMPLVESGTLKDLMHGVPLSFERIRRIIAQVGDALDYAHSNGLIHRDVKPSNVLIDERGNCLLSDFGIAKMIESTSQFTATGGLVGTPTYMSPEQGRGDEVDARTDIYTLGVILYEMATGRVPFEAETPVAVIFKHIQDPLPPPRKLNPDLPEALENVILKALAKEPQERFATAEELVQALQAAIPIPSKPSATRQNAVPERAISAGIDILPRHASGPRKVLNLIRRSTLNVWALLFVSLIVAGIVIATTLRYASKYTFLRVPFASGFVFFLCMFILMLNGVVFFYQRRLRRTNQALVDLERHPLEDDLPTVYGHKHLDKAEFLTILQILFRHTFDAKYIQARPLPGGHGGSKTVLTKLQRKPGAPVLAQSFVIKLGDRREMEDEYGKFRAYVAADLPQAARFFRYATWENLAGIAYEFVGLDPDHDIQSFYQFYQGHATVEVVTLVGRIYAHLDKAWYHQRREEQADIYREYGLLYKKREDIIAHVGELVDPDDAYRVNFTAIETKMQPNLKPDFCPDPDVPWYDPVAFLRTWARQSLDLMVCRSTVHGDLHAQNVLVEIAKNGHKWVWFIDFSHSGNGLSGERTREALRDEPGITPHSGHTLRDFCRLEADVKFILTGLRDASDLELAVAFEKALMACGLVLYDLSAAPPPVEALRDERFYKAWQVIREIRRLAARYLARPDDPRPYYLSLLNATLPIAYYHPDQFQDAVYERQQKRYALLAAGMLCHKL